MNHVDLTADDTAVETVPVKRVLGMNNMYEDLTQPTEKQQHQIEEIFGKLESQASPIFRRIVKGSEEGSIGLWLTRDERNTLRRFLFLLKYRGYRLHQRFCHNNAEEYDSDDKIELRQYTRDRGFQRPIDVWFDNIKAIAECKMDVEGNWMKDILKRMYPPDAMLLCLHTQHSYMALCSPSVTDAEFVLVANSYSIYEGINNSYVNTMRGERTSGPWLSFHDFAPISPKIMIVLRSLLLPVPEEDFEPEIRKARDWWRKAALEQVSAAGLQSELADLPITKARNNYTELNDGQLTQLQSHTSRSSKDNFFFKFFRINEEHVNKINSFMLDNAGVVHVFASPKIFTRTLEWFMTNSSQNWKNVVGTDKERLAKTRLLTKLAVLMKTLGSTAEPVWVKPPSAKLVATSLTEQRLNDIQKSQEIYDDTSKDLYYEATTVTELSHTPFLELYTKLGELDDILSY